MELTSILFYTSIFVLSYIITKQFLNKLQNTPPTPFPTLPIIGHLHLLKNPTQIHRTLAKISDRYGPVVQLWFGFRRVLLVSSASAAQDCFQHNDITFANRPRLLGAKILGYNYTNILWAPYGPLWRNHRRLASTEILSPHRLHLLAHIRTEEVRSLIKRIYNQSLEGNNNPTVEIKTALVELTNNVIMRMIAGKRMYGEEVESEEAKRFKLILKELLSSGGLFSPGDFFPFFKYLGLNKSNEKKWKGIFVKLDGLMQDFVDEERRKMGKDGDFGGEMSSKNLIQVLLGLQKNDPDYFTEDIIKGLVQILLLTGTETSSSIIEWAVTLLLKHPQNFTKVRNEIKNHVGFDRFIEEQDLQHLPYLHSIINETLRMYPAAPIIPPHESSDDCIVGGYKIPKGTMLNVNLWAIQNDPKVWDEPHKFKPERFENVEGDRIGYKFMPFGSGRRACPGENLANRVVGLTLGLLIQCFEWESVEDDIDMEEKVAVSMWKAKPLQAKFKPNKDMLKLLSQI